MGSVDGRRYLIYDYTLRRKNRRLKPTESHKTERVTESNVNGTERREREDGGTRKIRGLY